jgi:WD40 repeat protein
MIPMFSPFMINGDRYLSTLLATNNNQLGNGYADVYSWPGLSAYAPASGVAVNAAGTVDSMSFSPDGRYLAIAGFSSSVESYIYIYDTSDWSSRVLDTTPQWTTAMIVWRPDSSEFAVVSYAVRGLARYDVTDLSVIYSVANAWPAETSYSCSYSPDGLSLAYTVKVSGGDSKLFIFDLSDMSSDLTTLPGGAARRCEYSPDGSQMAIADGDGYLRILETTTWTITDTMALDSSPYSLDWSPDGTRLVVVNNDGTSAGLVRVYDTSTWTQVAGTLGAHGVTIAYGVAFSADGAYFAVVGTPTASPYNATLVFDATTLALVASTETTYNTRSVAFNRVLTH